MDVGDWLKSLGFEQYAEAFAENGVDLNLLPELTNEDLKDLGVARLADRKTILKAITRLSESEDETFGGPITPATDEGERRQVTVLFADLAGFTKLSSELGAEETHALLNRYFGAVDGIVKGYGGTIDKHMGDNVMAVFGAPIAHDDDPLRAVRAALDIQQTMTKLSDEIGHPLRSHIGIASGQVVASGTGSDAHHEYTVTGDSVNLASRLGDLAEPGDTLISDAVWHAISSHVECESTGDVTLKGIDRPVRVWSARALHGGAPEPWRRPFVGRRALLMQFSGVIEACRETGNGQAIFVRGEAGIGKTRLVEEFTAIAEGQGFVSHTGLVLDFGVGKSQDAVRALVRSLLGIVAGGGKPVRQAAAEASLSEDLLTVDQRVFLNDLLDLPQPVEDRATYDAMDNATRNRGKREVFAGLIKRLSTRQPLLLTVEDVHWADSITLAHVAAMAATVNNCPAVLLMTSRLEGDPLDQAWRSATRGAPLMTIDLGPLRDEEAVEFAASFIDATNQFAMSCIERAEGNPLFLEQLLRSAEERGDESVPASIQSLVLARMDRLPAADKRALQAASVIGQRFALDTLRHLIDESGYACTALIDHYLVRPEGEDFMFAHALIQEGVYSSLLKSRARELHGKAAEWFADREAVLRAQHLDRAEDPSAPQAYLDAAEAQAAEYRYERACSLVERGLELTVERNDKFVLTCAHGRLLHDLGSVPESIDAYRKALDLADDDAKRCQAWIGLAAGMRVTDDFDGAFDALAKAESAAKDHDLTLQLARIHHLRGNLHFPLGNLDSCLGEHELALDYARKAQSPEFEARALGGLGDAEYARGRMLTAGDYFSRCIELSRKHGFGRIDVAYLGMHALGRMYANDLSGARDESQRATDAAAKVGHQRAEINNRAILGYILLDLGELADAKAHFEASLDIARRLGARRFEAVALVYLGIIEALQGERFKGESLIQEAAAASRESGITFSGPWVLGALAYVTEDHKARAEALAEGDSLLRQHDCVSHNYFRFYRYGVEACLNIGGWDTVERYAQALEDYTRPEPLPWTDFFIARARVLVAYGRGKRDDATMAEITRLRDEAKRVGFRLALPALDEALAAA